MSPFPERLADFDFELPEHLIAQHPRPRGESRLLVVDRATGTWVESRVAELAQWLTAGDVLVANDSKVFPARLLGRRAGGGRAECLLLHHVPGAAETDWWALVNPGQRLSVGATIDFSDSDRAAGITFTGTIIERDAEGRRLVRLTVGGPAVPAGPAGEDGHVGDAIDRLGHIPLPPYIRRPDSADDRERYQTMFARERGSIAAPTAGLHFDSALMASLAAAGVTQATVTLHVGYGTFKPVKLSEADDVSQHSVDEERFVVPEVTARRIHDTRARGGRVVAVGTTTTRALESAARGTGDVVAGADLTDLCILPGDQSRPGHQFRAVDALLTNFHLPRSSLLLLVSAFAGRDLVLAAYQDAIRRGFMFYSYGDAMLIR